MSIQTQIDRLDANVANALAAIAEKGVSVTAEHKSDDLAPLIRQISASATVFAVINVTYPAGATVTCTKGATTLTANNTSGKWLFVIPEAGTWTVTATQGSNSKSQSVSITTEGQLEQITLSFEFVLFDGSFASGYSLNGNYISPAINLSQYTQMEVTASFYTNSGSLYVGICTNPSNVGIGKPGSAYLEFTSILNQYQTKTLNISAFNSNMYIGFWNNYWMSIGSFSVTDGEIKLSSGQIILRISKIVLR